MDGQPPPPPPPPPGQPLPPPPPGIPTVSGARPLTLQPMGVGEILDAAIRLYRAKWKSLTAIVAIALVPITFLQAFLTRSMGSPFSTEAPVSGDLDSTLITSVVLGVIQLLVIQPFLTAAIAK